MIKVIFIKYVMGFYSLVFLSFFNVILHRNMPLNYKAHKPVIMQTILISAKQRIVTLYTRKEVEQKLVYPSTWNRWKKSLNGRLSGKKINSLNNWSAVFNKYANSYSPKCFKWLSTSLLRPYMQFSKARIIFTLLELKHYFYTYEYVNT